MAERLRSHHLFFCRLLQAAMYKYAPIALAPLILAKTISRSRKVRADEKVRRASAA
jgi:hypothetical protein